MGNELSLKCDIKPLANDNTYVRKNKFIEAKPLKGASAWLETKEGINYTKNLSPEERVRAYVNAYNGQMLKMNYIGIGATPPEQVEVMFKKNTEYLKTKNNIEKLQLLQEIIRGQKDGVTEYNKKNNK